MRDKTELSARTIRADDCGYVAYHAPRYAYLLRLLPELDVTAGSRVLDIGPSRLTTLMREHCGVVVDSLGFGRDSSAPQAKHFEFDLNLAQDEATWRRDIPPYRCIVMAEVLEHLHTAPQLVLAFIKTLVAENGLLIIQTPNAASLPKRVKLVLGRNPYEKIRIDPSNPGHFREYTVSELRQLAESLGFRVERCKTAFYFDARFARHQRGHVEPQPVIGVAKNFLYPLFPSRFREGITMVWRKASAV